MASFTFITTRPPNPSPVVYSPPVSPGAGAGGGTLGDHLADADPHPQYLTQPEGDARYSQLGHTHVASQITDFAEAVDDRVAALAAAGAGLSVTYNDVGNVLTFANTDRGSTAVTAHEALSDPHSQYTTAAELATALVPYALLASPALTGTPTAPTAAPGTNTTQLGTTAFVSAAIAAAGAGYVASVTGTTAEITAGGTATNVVLSLPASLTFTGKTVTGGTFNAAVLSSTSGAFNGTIGATTPNTLAATTGSFSGAITTTAGGSISAVRYGRQANSGIYHQSTTSIDFANNGVHTATMDSANRLYLGHTSSVSLACKFQLHSDGGTLQSIAYRAISSGDVWVGGHTRSTTVGTFGTAVLNGDDLWTLRATGDDGTDIDTAGGEIKFSVSGVVAANKIPGRLTFLLADGVTADNKTEVLRAEVATGLSMFGANSVIDQNRHFRARSYTVAGLPATPAAGSIAYCSNEVGGAVMVFGDGTNWRRVTDRAIAA